ncbi:MAG: glycosyltransferase [Clostridia bacterium]|nr:glycosyltransferase [Clostridia bacterium]
MIDYSVIIRTTGKAKDKYRALLESIDNLVPKPVELIVVLPIGYDLPEEQLGYEKFYFSRKGMVIQRMTGIEKCKTKYALICDDDVKFEPGFVQKLYEPIKDGIGALSAGPLYSFLPPKGVKTIFTTLMASATPTIFHRHNRYVSVLKSTGYSFNRHLDINNTKYYETQSVAWTCFFADIHKLRNIDFDKEIWLDSHGYSALDDQTMFYKAWINGYKTIVVSNAFYEHLDAKTSKNGNKPNVIYSSVFNRVVFWHRFIYSLQKNILCKILAVIAFWYKITCSFIIDNIYYILGKTTKENKKFIKQAYSDAWKYVQSEEYKSLPKAIKENI